MSTNAHLGKLLGKSDDLESLVYSLIYLITGDLPWLKIKIKDPTDIHRVKEMKAKVKKYFNVTGSAKIPNELF